MSVNFEVKKIETTRIEEAANLVLSVFRDREPLSNAIASDSPEFSQYILELTRHCSETGLGFIAIDKESDQVAGAILAADLAGALNAQNNDAEKHNNPISSLVLDLNRQYFGKGQLDENMYLNIKFVATDSTFNVKGAVNEMIAATIDEAKAQGFHFAQAEATGNISQHIFINKFDFEDKGLIKYSDYEYEGTKPFASIKEHEGIKLVIKAVK